MHRPARDLEPSLPHFYIKETLFVDSRLETYVKCLCKDGRLLRFDTVPDLDTISDIRAAMAQDQM